jgi:hypothetical protein
MSLNVNLEKADLKMVDKYIAHYNLSVTGSLNAKINALEKHAKDTVSEADMSAACTVCGGESDFNLPECPYCGSIETNDATPTIADAAGSQVVDDKAPESAQPSKQRMGRPKPAKKTKGSKAKANGDATGIETAEPAAHTAELVHSKELDDAVGRIHQALRGGASSYWEMGTAMLEIFDKQLWKQRVVGGRQSFTSWNMFCREELALSPVNTFAIMDSARAFSKKDFEDIGHSKLHLMLRLPKERQQLLLEEAKQGRLPRSRLKEIIEGEVPKGHVRETGRRKVKGTTNAAKVNRSAARKIHTPDGEITAVSQLGRTKLKLWARPAKKAKSKPIRAISVTQDPWAEEQLVNGVVVRYIVMKTATGLELIIERNRPEKT